MKFVLKKMYIVGWVLDHLPINVRTDPNMLIKVDLSDSLLEVVGVTSWMMWVKFDEFPSFFKLDEGETGTGYAAPSAPTGYMALESLRSDGPKAFGLEGVE